MSGLPSLIKSTSKRQQYNDLYAKLEAVAQDLEKSAVLEDRLSDLLITHKVCFTLWDLVELGYY